MHCMGHWYSIRGVKACSSFRWIKQFTHLSVAKLIESNLLVSSDTGPEQLPVAVNTQDTYHPCTEPQRGSCWGFFGMKGVYLLFKSY